MQFSLVAPLTYERSAKDNDMKEDFSDPWIVSMSCPFCDEIIVVAVDYSLLPDDMPEEEREEITCTPEGFDYCDGRCAHLAFWSDWAYAGAFVENAWEREVDLIAKAFCKSEWADMEYEDGEDVDTLETVSSSLYNVFHGGGTGDREAAVELMRSAVKGVEIELVGGYIEKNDGVSGGGPTYMIIFMKKQKPIRKSIAQGQKSRKRKPDS
jgi:hypothetical protein